MKKLKKKTKQSLVSVVMPVYNAGGYLVESIESILDQTYKHFEFIIVDDHSTDQSWNILKRMASRDRRIKLFRNTHNMGVSETVKKAMSEAKGEYIARMDADDIALPRRFELQVAYLQSHPATVALGGQCDIINSHGRVVGRKQFPTSHEDIYRYIFTFVPVQQPTLMIARTRLPRRFEYYRDGMNTAEEVELFFKFFQYGKLENLNETVLQYRIHDANTSLINAKTTFFLTLISRLKAVVAYNYRPTASGVLFTCIQSALVLALPQSALILLYKYVRKMQSSQTLSFSQRLRFATS